MRKMSRTFSAFAAALMVCVPGALGLTQEGEPPALPETVSLFGTRAIDPGYIARASRYFQGRSMTLWGWLGNDALLVSTNLGDETQLYEIRHPGGMRRQLTFSARGIVAGFPQGGEGSFVYLNDPDGSELYQASVVSGSGEIRRITEPGTRNLPTAVSPDQSRLAWSQIVPGTARQVVYMMEPEASSSKRVVLEAETTFRPEAFSHDNRLLVVADARSASERRLFHVDLANGRSREIAGETGVRFSQVAFSRDGSTLYWLANAENDFAEPFSYDLRTGRTERILPSAATAEIEHLALVDKDRTLAFVENREGFSRLRFFDLAAGTPAPVPALPDGVIAKLDASPDGTKIAVTLATSTSPADIWVAGVDDEAFVRWTFSETGNLQEDRFAQATLAHARSFDGERIPFFVLDPPGNADAPRPVVIDIHGGPETQARPGFDTGAQMLVAELGAVVLVPNIRGSAGYGRRYLALDNGRLREDAIGDIGALLDWIETRDDLDSERVVVYGGSYGGYVVYASLARYADRLCGGVAKYGISDFVTFLEGTGQYRKALRRAEYGDERDPQMRAFLESISPLRRVADMSRPLLVQQGANDPRVRESESAQIVEALAKRGVPVWHLLFRNEGHGFRLKDNRILANALDLQFIEALFEGEACSLPIPAAG